MVLFMGNWRKKGQSKSIWNIFHYALKADWTYKVSAMMFGTKTFFSWIWLCTAQFQICNQTPHVWLKCTFSDFIKDIFKHFGFNM